jgi:hypothetical protein
VATVTGVVKLHPPSAVRHAQAGIGQLADAADPGTRTMGKVEIRLVLDIAEPPAGRLWVVRGPGQAHHPGTEKEIGFTGWLGLLRALYEVTAEPGPADDPGPDVRRARTGHAPGRPL